ncbi:hypothetical protein [Streptomyces syringium]|uniref:hypothetical protein n=1 Tax=Streptomyces syringium TaxID=76729 RepID=UPI0037D115E2
MTDTNPAAVLRATTRPTRYAVSCLPDDNIDANLFEITVEYRGANRWAVTRLGSCLGADGTWARGVKEYDRGDDWLAAHRFDLETALRLAEAAAPHVTVNGFTVADALRLGADQ